MILWILMIAQANIQSLEWGAEIFGAVVLKV